MDTSRKPRSRTAELLSFGKHEAEGTVILLGSAAGNLMARAIRARVGVRSLSHALLTVRTNVRKLNLDGDHRRVRDLPALPENCRDYFRKRLLELRRLGKGKSFASKHSSNEH